MLVLFLNFEQPQVQRYHALTAPTQQHEVTAYITAELWQQMQQPTSEEQAQVTPRVRS